MGSPLQLETQNWASQSQAGSLCHCRPYRADTWVRPYNSMKNPWIIAAMAGLAVLWLASLAAMRFWTRRRMLADFVARPGDGELPRPRGPRPEDRAALEIIRSRRHHYLWSRWPETALSFSAIQEMSLEIMKEIAGVYFPQEVSRCSRPPWRICWLSITGWEAGWRPGWRPLPSAPLRTWNCNPLSVTMAFIKT